MKSRRFLLTILFIVPLLGFSQASPTQKCMVVKQTKQGPIICFIPCPKNPKGGKTNGMVTKNVTR